MLIRYSFRCVLLAALLATSAQVAAADVVVTAEFKPDAANPAHNVFTNTTPGGFYCVWVPAQCIRHGIYMFDIPINVVKNYIRGPDLRKRWYFVAPPERTVVLTSDNGMSAPVSIAISSVSGQVTPGTSTNPLYTASPGGGCSYVRTSNNGSYVSFGWNIRAPAAPLPCQSVGQSGGDGTTMIVRSRVLGIGLRITTPSPLQLQNGTYTGDLTYTVGGLGNDFDFGDDVTTTDSSLTLRLQFTVAHDLKVSAPHGDVSRLQPLGGWSRWSEHGITPKALQSDLPFTITGSAPFSVKLDCEYPLGEQCAIRSNVDDDLAAVDIAISMPGIRSEATGSDATHYRLRANTGRETFMPTSPVAHRPSRLHFHVGGEPMRRMLDQPGSHWQGRATLIFDTEID